jgi:16S rRNA (guanine(966)-N(2))-methyltransferase RsmD
MIRIQAGEFRSRPLDTPEEDDERTRPMAARVKESIFAMLRGWFEDARVLDLFAGIGTMGLEAVSLGAKEVVLIERERDIFRYLQANIAKLHCADRAIAIQGDALGPLAIERAPKPVDLIFVDPPYAMMLDAPRRRHVLGQIKKLRSVMADKGFVVLRSPVHLPPEEKSIDGFVGPELHEYGHEMKVMLFMPQPIQS